MRECHSLPHSSHHRSCLKFAVASISEPKESTNTSVLLGHFTIMMYFIGKVWFLLTYSFLAATYIFGSFSTGNINLTSSNWTMGLYQAKTLFSTIFDTVKTQYWYSPAGKDHLCPTHHAPESNQTWLGSSGFSPTVELAIKRTTEQKKKGITKFCVDLSNDLFFFCLQQSLNNYFLLVKIYTNNCHC